MNRSAEHCSAREGSSLIAPSDVRRSAKVFLAPMRDVEFVVATPVRPCDRPVLDRASPLALFDGPGASESGRGLSQSKTLARGSWPRRALFLEFAFPGWVASFDAGRAKERPIQAEWNRQRGQVRREDQTATNHDAGTLMDKAQVSQWTEKLIAYLIENGPKLAGAVGILFVGFLVARTVGTVLERWLNKKDLEPPVRMLISRIVRLFIVAFALVVALGTCGFNIAPLVAGIGVAGVGIGLAMQGVLSNLVSGLLIIFTKPFRVGEYVEIAGCHGQVSVIELFTTVLVHPDRSRVVIPNRKIVGEILHNYGTIRQHEINVGVAYQTSLPEAIAVIQGVLERNPKVLKDPAPVVAVLDFGDSAINLAVRPWSNLSEFGPAAAEVKLAIVEAFRARRIEIPFPQREIRVLDGKSLV